MAALPRGSATVASSSALSGRYPYGSAFVYDSRYRTRYYPYGWGFGTGYPFRSYLYDAYAWRPYSWYAWRPWYPRWYAGWWYPYWGFSCSIVLGYPYTWVGYCDPWYWYSPTRTVIVDYPYVEYRYYPYYVSAEGSVSSEVEVPVGTSAAPAYREAPREAPVEEGGARESVPERPSAGAPASELHPLRSESTFEESLPPAQRSFVAGLYQLRFGEFEAAVDAFYEATLEDPSSRVPKLFLGLALVATGEKRFAAEYIRLSLDGWAAFPALAWDLHSVYPDAAAFESDLRFLEEAARLDPADADALFLLGFYRFHGGDLAGAGRTFEALMAVSDDPLDRDLAKAYLAEAERRSGAEALAGTPGAALPLVLTEEDAAVQRFLSSLSPESALDLPIR